MAHFCPPRGVDLNHYIAHEQDVKKALKKVKEIERLQQKPELNREEAEKVGKLQEYLDILYPPKPPVDPNVEERCRAQKQRHDEKCRKKDEEAKKRAKKLLDEEKSRNKRRREEPEEQYAEGPQQKINKVIDEVELEFIQEMANGTGDPGKAFRKLSLKYHPDKNVGRKEWAEEKQKFIQGLYEKYSELP